MTHKIEMRLDDDEYKQLRLIERESIKLQRKQGSWFSSSECTSQEQRDLAWILSLIFHDREELTND